MNKLAENVKDSDHSLIILLQRGHNGNSGFEEDAAGLGVVLNETSADLLSS